MAASKRKARDEHPEEELRRLAQVLQEGLPSAVILKGEERYFIDRAVTGLVAAAKAAGHEICRHDAKDPEFQVARLLDDVAGGALFASARCVVLLNATDLLKKTGKGCSPAFLKAAVGRLATGGEDLLVIHAPSVRADNVLAKAALKAGGLMLSCRKLWDSPPPWDPDPRKAELVQWLVNRARARKIPLSIDQAAYVAAATGNDLGGLDEQLSRVQAGGGDLKDLVGWDAGGSPYKLADHMLVGDAARAVGGIESLFASGFSAKDGTRTLDRGGLVSMLCNALSSKVREALSASDALAAGIDGREAASLAGARGAPAMQQAFLERAKRRSPAQWRACLEQVAGLERRSRSSAVVDAADFCGMAFAWRLQR
ncbi:MAG: DNA polymerase III delta subunit [Planctomycetota bacterium]|jgi:DNA polymerase III delta subunit